MERLQEVATLFGAALAGMFGLLIQQITFIAMPLPEVSPHADVLFVGDMMFDRTIRQAMESYGSDFVFSCIATNLAQAQYVVGNLEGPITANPSRSLGSEVGSHDNFVFTFPEYVAPLLKRQNIGVVSLGNNHILNFDMDGVDSTVHALTSAGVGYFGEPGGHSVSQLDTGPIQISYIGYNEFDSGWTASTTITEIIDARAKGRIPVVYAHWGDEYKAANDQQKKLAHQFIDAGAELVMGAHPHVIQEAELYKGKNIYYSLGNFIFDQYWNTQVSTGLMVFVRFDEDGVVSVSESNVSLQKDRRTCPIARE